MSVERPILMSAPMVLATLRGDKTQTRRVMNPQPSGDANARCRYGVPGDRLYVRETWAPADIMVGSTDRDPPQFIAYRADRTCRGFNDALEPFEADTSGWRWEWFDGRWKPSIFLPKWGSRIWLELVEVRTERLQSISDDDCVAEGIEYVPHEPPFPCWRAPGDDVYYYTPRGAFRALWDRINGKRAGCRWDDNPWVWVVRWPRFKGSTAA